MVKVLHLFVFLFLLLAGLPSAQSQSIERRLKQAYKQSTKGKWDKALENLQAVFTEDSLQFDALLLKGDILLRSEQWADAYRTALQLSSYYPDSLASWLLLGEVQTALDSFPQAEQAYLQAYRLAPEAPELHLNLGILYTQAGLAEAAETHFDYAYQALPATSPLRQEVLFHLGMLCFEKQEEERALGYFNQIINEAPDFHLAYVGKAYCQYTQKRYKEALQLLAWVEKKAPHLLNKEDYVLWAKNLYGLKQRNKAIQVLRLLPEPLPIEGYQLLARMLYEHKAYEQALDYLQKAISAAQTPEELGSLFHDRALVYLALQQPQKALVDYSEALYLWYPVVRLETQNKHQGVLQPCLYDAGKLLNQHFSKDTLEHIRRQQWHELALTLLYEGEAKEAENICRQLIAYDSADALAWQYQGTALLLQNYTEEAEKALLNALEFRTADSVLVYELLAEAALAQEKLSKAHQYITLAIGAAPANADALHFKGYLYSLQEDYLSAHEWACRALKFAPQNSDIRKDAMQWALHAGLCAEAQFHAGILLKTEVYAIEAWLTKAHCALEQGNLKQAEDFYENAAALANDKPEVRRFYRKLQEAQKAASTPAP